METRIGTSQPASPVPPSRTREREAQQERRFVIPRREPEDGEDAESTEEQIVLEPQPRCTDGDKPVSRALLEDEAGHRIDVRG